MQWQKQEARDASESRESFTESKSKARYTRPNNMQDGVKWGKSRQTRYYRDNSDSAAAHSIEETLAWVD